MKLVEFFARSSSVETIGWALLHFLWQGALLAGVLGGVLVALRGSSSRLRYFAACLALLVMSVCPILTCALLTSPSLSVAAIAVKEAPLARTAPDTAPSEIRVPSTPSPAEIGSAPPPRVTLERALPWLVAVWLLGVFLQFVHMLGALTVLHRLTSRAAKPAPEPLQTAMRALALRMKLQRLPRLLESGLVRSPMVIGGLRAVILLPASALTGLSTPMLESLLAHELAHLRRHDYLINLWQSAVETVLFFHPAVWWVSQHIRIEREHCCDDIVIATLHDRRTYALALTTLEELRSRTPALAATDGELLARIRRIVTGETLMPTKNSPASIVLAIALALLISTPILAAYAGRQASTGGPAGPLAQKRCGLSQHESTWKSMAHRWMPHWPISFNR